VRFWMRRALPERKIVPPRTLTRASARSGDGRCGQGGGALFELGQTDAKDPGKAFAQEVCRRQCACPGRAQRSRCKRRRIKFGVRLVGGERRRSLLHSPRISRM